MTAQVYEFTAFDPHADKSYTFTGYQFPNGGVMIPEESTHDSFFDCLENVEANGNDTIESYENTGKTVEFTDDELREAVKGSAREFGHSAIPAEFEPYLMIAEIRIWDECASDSFFVDADGNVYDKDGKKSKRRTSDWGHLIDDDGTNDAAAITEIIADWSDGYDGDASNIRAEITRM